MENRKPRRAPGPHGLQPVVLDGRRFVPSSLAAPLIQSTPGALRARCRREHLRIGGHLVCVVVDLQTHAHYISEESLKLLQEERFVDFGTRTPMPVKLVSVAQAKKGREGYISVQDAARLLTMRRSTLHMRVRKIERDESRGMVAWDQLLNRRLISTRLLRRWRRSGAAL